MGYDRVTRLSEISMFGFIILPWAYFFLNLAQNSPKESLDFGYILVWTKGWTFPLGDEFHPWEPWVKFRMALWHSGHRVHLHKWRSQFWIPPGCNVFRYYYKHALPLRLLVLNTCCANTLMAKRSKHWPSNCQPSKCRLTNWHHLKCHHPLATSHRSTCHVK
jgi:hypothetical protein